MEQPILYSPEVAHCTAKVADNEIKYNLYIIHTYLCYWQNPHCILIPNFFADIIAKIFSGDGYGAARDISIASQRNTECIQSAVSRAVGAGRGGWGWESVAGALISYFAISLEFKIDVESKICKRSVDF